MLCICISCLVCSSSSSVLLQGTKQSINLSSMWKNSPPFLLLQAIHNVNVMPIRFCEHAGEIRSSWNVSPLCHRVIDVLAVAVRFLRLKALQTVMGTIWFSYPFNVKRYDFFNFKKNMSWIWIKVALQFLLISVIRVYGPVGYRPWRMKGRSKDV